MVATLSVLKNQFIKPSVTTDLQPPELHRPVPTPRGIYQATLEELPLEIDALRLANPDFTVVDIDPKLIPTITYTRYMFEMGFITYEQAIERYIIWMLHPVFIALWIGGRSNIFFRRVSKRGDPQYVSRNKKKNYAQIFKFLKFHGQNLNYWKFITLTMRYSSILTVKEVSREINRLVTLLKYHAKKQGFSKLHIFRCSELQIERWVNRKELAVHAHLLVHGLRYVPGQWLTKVWNNGRTDIKRPRSVKGISAYLTGYLEKSFSDPMNNAIFWMYRGRQWSSNFPNTSDPNYYPCHTRSISKIDLGLGDGDPQKTYYVGVVNHWWGADVSLKKLEEAGHTGHMQYIASGNHDQAAAELINEIKTIRGFDNNYDAAL